MGIIDHINEQPAAVAATLAATRTFRAGWRPASGGLRLIGSGSSRNALLAAEPTLARASLGTVTMHQPADVPRLLADGALPRGQVVVLSQSGASVTSVAAARAAHAAGLTVLAITADAGSALATSGVDTLLLPIGQEQIGPKTKGFTASLACLLALGGAAGEPALTPLLAPARDQAAAWLDPVSAADCLMIAGAGSLHGIALEASLKIAEVAGMPTAAYPWEEVLHGRLHGLTERGLCMVLCDDADTRAEAMRAQAAMRARGAKLLIVDAPLSPPWSALAAVLPFQFLAVLLACARGLVPETMRYPGLSADLAIKAPA